MTEIVIAFTVGVIIFWAGAYNVSTRKFFRSIPSTLLYGIVISCSPIATWLAIVDYNGPFEILATVIGGTWGIIAHNEMYERYEMHTFKSKTAK